MDSRLAPLLALRSPPWRTKGRPSIQMTRMPSILGSSAQSSGGSCKSDAGPAAGAGGYQGRVKVGMEVSDVGENSTMSQFVKYRAAGVIRNARHLGYLAAIATICRTPIRFSWARVAAG